MSERSLLQLLLEEAPVEAFEEPVHAAMEQGASDDEIVGLRAQTAVALQIRTVLAERRRREAELAALYETAGDLTSLRDLEALLHALVQRARRLLGTDVAYLTLFDEQHGDTYMRVTDGIVTPSFRTLRLAMGTGLGGLVAQTRQPYATSNYLTDERFAHTRPVDESVGAEGIIAILGVPLQFAGRVTGVLFTANRHERPFAPEEVALLSSLAAHAAVAIENARLFGETQETMAELAAANRLVREHSEAVERAASAHEQLTNVVLRGGDVDQLVAALCTVLGGGVRLVSDTGRTLAATGVVADAGDIAEALAEARRNGRTVRTDTVGGATWVTPVLAGHDYLGALILAAGNVVAGADLRTLERGAQVTALLLLNQRSTAEAERRVRGELLDDLLTAPRRDPEALRRRGMLLGTDLDVEHCVVVAHAEGIERHRVAQAAVALAGDIGGLGGEHAGDAVVLLPGRDGAEAARFVSDRLRTTLGHPVTAGGAGPAAGPIALADAYGAARRCLKVLHALGRTGSATGAGELGVYGLLLSEAGREDLATFLDQRLGPVIDYDRRRRTDLIGTLDTYFSVGGNHARAAAALHVHVNTLYQRLDRIGQLLGSEWSDADNALQIHLALRILRLSEMLDGG